MLFGAGLIGAGLAAWHFAPVDIDSLRLLVEEERFSELEAAAKRRLYWFPNDYEARLWYGEALQRRGDTVQARAEYDRIPNTEGESSHRARVAAASLHLLEGDLTATLGNLDAADEISPGERIVDRLRIDVANLSGVRDHVVEPLLRLIDTDPEPLNNLVFLAVADEMPAPDPKSLERLMRSSDPLAKLGAARVASAVGKSEMAVRMFNEVIAARPDLVDSYVQLALIHLDLGQRDDFRKVLSRTPESAKSSPEYWAVRGRAAMESGRKDIATRCYWEANCLNPNLPKACYQLGQLLIGGPFDESAKKLQLRSKALVDLQTKALQLHRGHGNPDTVFDCARLSRQLGRIREARVWCEYLLAGDPGHPEGKRLLAIVAAEWRDDLPWVLPAANPSLGIDGTRFPLPPPAESSAPTDSGAAERAVGDIPWRFAYRDVSDAVGIRFQYENGSDPRSEGKRMFEYTGGGVAAIDYDLDRWPDLYFTQGTRWPPDPNQREHLDVLYRNRGGRGFVDVAREAGIVEQKFSQGVSAGDLDNDGFTDLYVANMGGNRLFLNLGDGTFQDVTRESGAGHPEWTTSCAIADLDGDSAPDLYDATFLTGADVFQMICEDAAGRKRSCAPAGFNAAPDYVWFSRGDGSFENRTKSAGFDVPNGDGLGILIADFTDSGRAQVFIANDGRANFLFVPDQAATGVPTTRWTESAVAQGCAFDEVGQAQACMGIAAGDFDGDGAQDFFVTNFFYESNTLYLNSGAGTFSDRTRQFGLRTPSLDFLGFGAQCIDPNHDGRPDLVIVNGHVDDFTHKDIPYKMRPQFFLNRGGRFDELIGTDLLGDGPLGAGEQGFFATPSLGRGLAVLDWNRDGRTDLVTSRLEERSALVSDTSTIRPNALRVKLVAVTGARDAIGARLEWSPPTGRQSRQLFGGDGYHASNERCVDFGGGGDVTSGDLRIVWPGGRVQTVANVASGREVLVIEGRTDPLTITLWLPHEATVAETAVRAANPRPAFVSKAPITAAGNTAAP